MWPHKPFCNGRVYIDTGKKGHGRFKTNEEYTASYHVYHYRLVPGPLSDPYVDKIVNTLDYWKVLYIRIGNIILIPGYRTGFFDNAIGVWSIVIIKDLYKNLMSGRITYPTPMPPKIRELMEFDISKYKDYPREVKGIEYCQTGIPKALAIKNWGLKE